MFYSCDSRCCIIQYIDTNNLQNKQNIKFTHLINKYEGAHCFHIYGIINLLRITIHSEHYHYINFYISFSNYSWNDSQEEQTLRKDYLIGLQNGTNLLLNNRIAFPTIIKYVFNNHF